MAGGKSGVTADFCCISGQTLPPHYPPLLPPQSDQNKEQLGWFLTLQSSSVSLVTIPHIHLISRHYISWLIFLQSEINEQYVV